MCHCNSRINLSNIIFTRGTIPMDHVIEIEFDIPNAWLILLNLNSTKINDADITIVCYSTLKCKFKLCRSVVAWFSHFLIFRRLGASLGVVGELFPARGTLLTASHVSERELFPVLIQRYVSIKYYKNRSSYKFLTNILAASYNWVH